MTARRQKRRSSMKFHVKPRIMALAIRVSLSVLSMSGSSLETGATKLAVRTEAGLVSGAAVEDASVTVYGDPGGRGLLWPAFDTRFSTVMELSDGFMPIAVADAAGLDFVRQMFLVRNAW
jgi:hypothetical protein